MKMSGPMTSRKLNIVIKRPGSGVFKWRTFQRGSGHGAALRHRSRAHRRARPAPADHNGVTLHGRFWRYRGKRAASPDRKRRLSRSEEHTTELQSLMRI